VLTLLALLLAIGLVVDDAIVMLENIERRLASGETRLQAAVRGSRQVTFAILATSITLIAVFVPISFLQGAAGKLFTEFGSCWPVQWSFRRSSRSAPAPRLPRKS
jgi:multidrug efflux pump